MRMSLVDVKNRVMRRGGEPTLLPYLLRKGELSREMQALIELYEASIGTERAAFPSDRPAELIGDFRIGRGLTICLEEWYEWQPVSWPGTASAQEAEALASLGIHSPSELRLALFDRVNDGSGGYLSAAERGNTLDTFAAEIGVSRATLDALLPLDAEARLRLIRCGESVPTPMMLAARYNQQVFEALLVNSSRVEWRIIPPASGEGTPLGTVVKRLCFLARRMGVQYDVAFDDATPDAADAPTEDETPLAMVAERRALYAVPEPSAEEAEHERGTTLGRAPVRVTLYGPQEVMGAPQQYGERLARLCRALLGYRRAATRGGSAAFEGVEFVGSARVYLRGTPMTLPLDERMMRSLKAGADAEASATPPDASAADAEFDSSVEAHLYAEFMALERTGEAHGWRLEREPEPLVAGDVILIPDFTLTRGPRRVYVEIAGYWRPEYRERKARKLRAVLGMVDQLLAAPESARGEFASLVGELPVVWYKTQIGATALLAAADRAYDDFAQRLATLDFARIAAEVEQRGCIPPVEAMVLLRCYSRNDLGRVMDAWERSSEATARWVDGLGLCSPAWLDDLLEFARWTALRAPDGRIALADLAQALGEHISRSEPISPETIGSLVTLAGLHMRRDSLFAAEVSAVADDEPHPPESPGMRTPAVPAKRAAQPRPSARRKERETMVTPFLFLPPESPETESS